MKVFYSIFLMLSFFIFPLILIADKTVSINDVSLTEGDAGTKTFNFTVAATSNTPDTDKIDYIVYDSSATVADSDYIAASGTVGFSASSDSATISVTINGDTTPEIDETFTVVIFNLVSSSIDYIADHIGIGTIINDDFAAWPPIMSDIPDQIVIKGINYILDISNYTTQTNPASDPVTYTLIDINTSSNFDNTDGLFFNATTGVLSGTPTNLNATYYLRATSIDADGNTSVDFTLTVDDGFCYEYSYSQELIYFTESNIDGHPPMLVSDSHYIDTNYPVAMTIYLRHASSLDIRDLNVSVLDINTTQVEYVLGTTTLTTKNSIIPTDIPDGAGTSISNIRDIPIGDINYGDYFYINYDLNPQIALLDTPINVNLSFTAYGTSYDTLNLGYNVPLCSLSAGSGYAQVSAIFNAVHKDYYDADLGGSKRYYNLPTQVVKREGNFKIIALEPGTDNLKPIETVPVAVELIDVDMFGGDMEAACQDPSSAITPRVWLIFDNNTSSMDFSQTALQTAITNGMTDLTLSSDFYKEAHKNVAFRTSYFYSGNGDDLLTLSAKPGPEYNVNNFPDVVKIGKCVADVDGNLNNQDTVAQFCDNAGEPAAMTPSELKTCLECVYGLATKLTCSRDNFSIRPEAFDIHINDQNQTNPVVQPSISSPANLAAGYNYNIEVTATGHIDNNQSVGYTQYYTDATVHKAQYKWNGPLAGCNDDSNKTITISFSNGLVDENNSLAQVGDYLLNITDNTWTAVDSDWTEMAHHSTLDANGNALFINNIEDCIIGDTVTQLVNYSTGLASPFTGCNISSSHTNPNTALTYSDYVAEFHPYKFDMSTITPSHGLNSNTTFDANTFIYMADMSQDENMSFHLNGPIRASGFNDSNLSNFVDGCYAKPVRLIVNKSPISGAVAYKSRFNTFDSIGSVILTTNADMNTTAGFIDINTTNFKQNMIGSINTTHNLNFDRNLTIVMNPEKLTFSSYDTNCTNPATDCTFSADLISNKTTQGTLALDNNVTHYYGRSHASRQRYEGPTGTANIYYEVYCFGNTNGNTCNKVLLQNGLNSTRTDDLRWYINEEHNTTNDGNIGTVQQKDATPLNAADDIVDVTAQNDVFPPPATATLQYDETKGYPYKATMHNNPSGWLIYNKDDPTATRNQFSVEFEKIGGDWSGKHDTDTVTKDANATRTNRRIMW